jgi:uncharacterized protein (UPF0276 family)
MGLFPSLGAGLGLRIPHYEEVLRAPPRDVGFFEVITENFLGEGGNPRRVLFAVREHRPVALHGVSLGIGRTDPLDALYLGRVRRLVDELDPAYVSDHICWTGIRGMHGHDLWPLPFTEESLRHVVARVRQVQDVLGRRILLENASAYLEFQGSTIEEGTWIRGVLEEADCGLLLDVNNVYVCARNQGTDPWDVLRNLPPDRIGYAHLAGHNDLGTHVIDSHDHPVADAVWALFAEAAAHLGLGSVVLERDDHIPPLGDLLAELRRAASLLRARAEPGP